MKVAILTSILAAFSHLAFSIPVSEVGYEFSSLQSRNIRTIYPVILVIAAKDYPDLSYGSGEKGYVIRQNGTNDAITFVTFMLDQGFPGKQCRLGFLGSDKSISDTGESLVQVYSVPGTLNTNETFRSEPDLRGQFWSTLKVGKNSTENSWTPSTPTFPCPEKGPATLRFVLVPASDDANLEFTKLNGLVLNIS